MSQYHQRMSGRKRQERNRRILAASDVCHICGHQGADAVDHVIPLARGGSEDPSNLRPAHHDVYCPTCQRRCNRDKADKLMPDINRRVVLICGPPGSGKTTLAHSLGLDEVFDLDDDRWGGSDPLFRAALVRVRENPRASAAVIRTAATLSARRKGATNCGATEVVVLDTPLATCVERIKARGRTNPPIRYQINGAREWWQKYEPGDVPLALANLKLRRSHSLTRP